LLSINVPSPHSFARSLSFTSFFSLLSCFLREDSFLAPVLLSKTANGVCFPRAETAEDPLYRQRPFLFHSRLTTPLQCLVFFLPIVIFDLNISPLRLDAHASSKRLLFISFCLDDDHFLLKPAKSASDGRGVCFLLLVPRSPFLAFFFFFSFFFCVIRSFTMSLDYFAFWQPSVLFFLFLVFFDNTLVARSHLFDPDPRRFAGGPRVVGYCPVPLSYHSTPLIPFGGPFFI